MQFRRALAGGGGVLCVTAVMSLGFDGTQSAARATQSAPSASSPCIVRDASGAQEWLAEPGANAVRAGDELQKLVDEHPDQATAVVVCSHYEGFIVALPASDRGLELAVTSIAKRHPKLHIGIVRVAYALNPLQKVMRAISADKQLAGVLTAMSPDAETGGLRIRRKPEASLSPSQIAGLVDKVARPILGGSLPLAIENGAVGQT